MIVSKSTRRWYQYSLRNLLLLMTILCLVPGGYVAYHRNRARRQEAAVAAIEQLKGTVRYKDSLSPRSAAMQWLLGDDKFSRVNGVDFPPFEAKVTDTDLTHIEGMEGLEFLSLVGTEVTDVGVARLQRLIHLRTLELAGTRITDRGLIHLRKMVALERLTLYDTEVGDAGMAHLTQFPQLKELYLGRTHISDAGISQLKSLTHLELISIEGTQVTEQGADELERVPGLIVVRK